MVNFYYIFRPFIFLYPFSPIIASASSNNVHESLIYRFYIIIASLAVNGGLVGYLYYYTYVLNKHWTIVNRPCYLSVYSIYFTMMAVESMRLAKKNKIKKLMDVINQLNDSEFKVNERKYKIYNTILTVVLMINQVCYIVIINTNVTQLFLISSYFINMMTNSEIILFASFVTIFDSKMKSFVSLLEEIIKKKEVRNYDLFESFSQMMYILKRFNNVWNRQLLLIICFEMYFSTRMILNLLVKKGDLSNFISILSMITKYMVIVRHFIIYLQLGLLGQWVSERFRTITALAGTIHDMDIGEDLTHQTWQISRLSEVCPGQLQASPFIVDGQLPLRAASAVISTVILIMQLGISID